ncbi:MAG: hypothetical protein WD598_12415 [Acidimicrobiia bacterium]
MPVDQDYRNTASARRAHIIRALTRELDVESATSAAAQMRDLLHGTPRTIVMSGDIDGIVSAMMLAAVSDWRVGAMVVGSERYKLHPQFASATDIVEGSDAFGVDVFSTLFPSASNHPVLWGTRRLGGSAAVGQACAVYDQELKALGAARLFANPSLWVGIEASVTDTAKPASAVYRYPMGTAQFLLALLEAAGRAPRMFDREFLPWLTANCDGGVETIRQYPFNVPMWWSALAAAVGPGSLSEHLYRLVSDQRPNEFVDVDRRLRYEEHERAALALNTKWNLINTNMDTMKRVIEWITDISGWPDPFIGGAGGLDDWSDHAPERGVLSMARLPEGGLAEVQTHLDASLKALHTSFSFFDANWRLGWLMPA